MFAGYNTYVGALASALHVVADPSNVAVVARLRQETDQLLTGDTVKFEEYKKLTYHAETFKEVLRLFGPTPCIARKVHAPAILLCKRAACRYRRLCSSGST